MIILLHSKLFTKDPSIRFGETYKVPHDMLRKMWGKHELNGWNNTDLAEYFHIKTGKKPGKNVVGRWVRLIQIYMLARPYVERGQRAVQSEVFGPHERYIIQEITKNMRFGGKQSSRTML
jgi:hypothetical protein